MNYQVPYQIENKIQSPQPGNCVLDAEIGKRFDRFAYERISSDFAVKEILREAEDCILDQYDDEYCIGMWRGEFWGKQILSAVGVCRVKQDEELKEVIRKSVYRMLAHQKNDGYLGSYREGNSIFRADEERCKVEGGWPYCYNWNVWGQKYTLWALLESALLLDDPHILACCRRLADHLVNLFAALHARVKDAGVMHGMPACSILNPMLLLYRLTGEPSYLDFCLSIADQWEREDNEWPNLITNGLSGLSSANWYDPKIGWTAKAYEMMSCYEGLIELYRITGTQKYLTATEHFWSNTLRDEKNILGSVGYCERFANAASYPDAATEICDVIHWMRLCHQLFSLTGEWKYMDAFEDAFLNAFLAGVYEDGRSGAFFVRSAGRHWTAEWQVETKYQNCCINNIARGFVNAGETAIQKSSEEYYVNLYIPARVRFGHTTFRIGIGYADRGEVAITIRGAKAGQKVHLRIPSWSKTTRLYAVGDQTYDLSASSASYTYTLKQEDQVLRLSFDMTPRLIDFPGTFRKLADTDYHVRRWKDGSNGLCDRSLMVTEPMSIIRRGPLLLARSKRTGSSEAEKFNSETVFGKKCTITAETIRHDNLLTLCRVNLVCEGTSYNYVMCDYASAANRDLEDVSYFTVFV